MSDLQFLMHQLNQSATRGPRQIAGERRQQAEENALLKILNQQAVQQNEAGLRGQKLQNTRQAQQIAHAARPQGVSPLDQARIDNVRSQIEERQRQAKAPKPLSKAKESLVPYLSPELQVNPTLAKDGDFARAAHARAKEAAKPTLAEQKFKADQSEASVSKDKASGLKDDVIRLATELRNHPGLDSSVGTIQGSDIGRALTVNQDSQDFINKYDQLKSILTSTNLDLMTGVLSETDIKILSDIAGGGLKLRGSEDAFRGELEKLGGVAQSKYGDVSEEDIQETMRANNLTREQVLERIKNGG